MPDDGVLLIPGDVVGSHAGKEIVGMIVLPDVIETELPVFALAQPPFGSAVSRRRVAVRPLASGTLGPQTPILVRPDPDAVEQGRVFFHDRSVCAQRQTRFKT